MTPEHRSEIRLDDKVRPEKENVVRLFGSVAPSIKDQQLRVDLTAPGGSVVTTHAKTDDKGRFTAAFDLAQKRKAPSMTKGKDATYAFQARIINATQLASADSNIVWYRAADRTKESR